MMKWIPTAPGFGAPKDDGVERLRRRILFTLRQEAQAAEAAVRHPFGIPDPAFHPGGGKPQGDMAAPFHLGVVLERAVESTRLATLGKGNRLALNKDSDVPTHLHGDGWRLQRAAVLLLGYLCRLGERATITLSVGLESSLSDTVRIRFQVRSNRPVEEPLPEERTESPHLAFARALLMALGGELTGPHGYGLGVSYRFSLPFLLVAEEGASGHSDPGPDAGASWTRGTDYPHCRRVLLAEDNRVTQAATRMLLEKRGHEVCVVEDGSAAVEMVRTKVFDVILMDLDMPGTDGVEATRAIRTFPSSGPPIIAYTAHSLLEDRRLCLEAGVDGFLAKPVSSDDLFRAVERWPRRSDA